jgi:hypothetical protein
MSDKDFDWVSVLSNCSVAGVFERLKLQVKADVEKRQSLMTSLDEEHSKHRFSFVSNGTEFSAVMEGKGIHRAVTFSIGMGNGITVRDENDLVMFHAVPTVDDDGDCVLKVAEKERKLWQVRKLALENLLFGRIVR